MADYAIGDVQGCFDELMALLRKIDFQTGKDTVYFVGDVVNRGPKSLQTLEFIYQNQTSMQTVLGNHDLHLLAVAHTDATEKKGDTIAPILTAKNKTVLLDWLRTQPLLIHENNRVIVHAGLYPSWDLDTAKDFNGEIQAGLSGRNFITVLKEMYGNKPKSMKANMDAMETIRFGINSMTRMRTLDAQHNLDFDYKRGFDDMPAYLHAWFEDTLRQDLDVDIIFGHWSAIGLYANPDKRIYGLDTGAIWQGQLTAMDLDSKAVFQVNRLKPE